ncbi:MAG: hypothetical protein M1833_000020 [Piccolia ochrophora]|nr:MAG: hypothetical protein M1833_000020 [Piccolia ochrophora]
MYHATVANVDDEHSDTPSDPASARTATPTTSRTQSTKKRKRTKPKPTTTHPTTSITIRDPSWSYLNLELTTTSPTPTPTPLDDLTTRTHLTAALTQHLGLSGTAIPVDILKTSGRECWLRVPREDLTAVVAAVGGWIGHEDGSRGEEEKIGWRVRARGKWLSALVGAREAEEVWRDRV